MDQEERKKYYFRIQKSLLTSSRTFLFIPYSLVAVHKRIKGIEPGPAGIGYNNLQ